ncbi:MAG: glucosaminidase domain-containing protein [Acidimicrobiia bacterium]
MRAVTHFLRLFVASVLCLGAVIVPGAVSASTAGAVETGIPVMGPSRLNAGQLANWFRATKRTPLIPVSIDQLAQYYIDEGNAEGVRGDIAFAQSIVETGYFGFVGSIVKPENYNYAGMGACDTCNSGRQFPSAQIGVRAQIQHLKNFADPTSRAATLANPPVLEWYGRCSDGTFKPLCAIANFDHFFAKGHAPTWNQMGGPGKWASTPTYGDVVIATYNRMLVFNGLSGTCPPDRLAFAPGEATECPLPIRQAGRAIAGTSAGSYVLNGNGAVKTNGVPYFGAPAFSFDIARDIAVMPDKQGYVVLDGFGGIHLYGSAATGPLRYIIGPYFGFDIARSIVVTADGAGLLILDGYGGIHALGTARRPAGGYPYWPGWDIARSIATTLDGTGLVELDGFGGVWTFGTMKRLGTTYFGYDIGRDIVAMPGGDGYALIDGFGGIHRFGSAPAEVNVGYATFDRWRGLVIRNGKYTAVRGDGFTAG